MDVTQKYKVTHQRHGCNTKIQGKYQKHGCNTKIQGNILETWM